MTRERSEADADADKPLHSWTLGEVDALLDEDNALAGLGSYETEPEFPYAAVPQPAREELETSQPEPFEEAEPEEESEPAEPEPAQPQPAQSGRVSAFGRLFAHKRKKEPSPQPETMQTETPAEQVVPFLSEESDEADAPDEPEAAAGSDASVAQSVRRSL